jgi:hypothetical protein
VDRSSAREAHPQADNTKRSANTVLGKLRRIRALASYLVPALLVGALWFPVFQHYHVSGVNVTDSMIQQARESPSDPVLEELKDFRLLEVGLKNREEVVDVASWLLRGELRIPGFGSAPVTLPFSAQDLDHCGPNLELPLAGFVVPDILLQAYEATGRTEFLDTAQAVILKFQAYEQTAILPKGELWNDHAIAARIPVLANFWRLYRHSPNYQPEVARAVLQMVARSEQLLAKPGHFTFATNHGVMQNLALWHASLAFPSLPETQAYQRLARVRMDDQMQFYVTREGMVLEHSPGYHLYGLKLLGLAFRYLDLMDQKPPQQWVDKYRAAKLVYAALRRPDGSLPMFGDTDSGNDLLGPLTTRFTSDHRAQRLAYESNWRPAKAEYLDPVAGYSVWWDGLEFWPDADKMSQTVVTWANFGDHGHKHADEMSLLLWAGGQTWWSNVGYWPYGTEGREAAESWDGSNAPHLAQESYVSRRTTRVVSSGGSEKLNMLELERTGPQDFIARRQVIHRRPDLWIVLDSTAGGENSYTRTSWTTASKVRWDPGSSPGIFLLGTPDSSERLTVFFSASQRATQKLFHGSSHPFAGWHVEEGIAEPSTSLVTEQPANRSWAATVWTWQKTESKSSIAAPAQMALWSSPTDWEMQLPNSASNLKIRRQGNLIQLRENDGPEETLQLSSPPNVSAELAQLHDQFVNSALRYHRFRDDSSKKLKIIYLLVGLFLVQQVFFEVLKRISATNLELLRWINLAAWIIGGSWLVGFYFGAWIS